MKKVLFKDLEAGDFFYDGTYSAMKVSPSVLVYKSGGVYNAIYYYQSLGGDVEPARLCSCVFLDPNKEVYID